jgi:CubicO group peptidase (beta-lactamase class C family)
MMGVPQRLLRMSRPILILTVALSLVLSVTAGAADDLVLDRFGAYLDSLRAQAAIPGLAAVLVGSNNVMREFTFGWKDVDRSYQVQADTPFHADGLTQLLTTSLALLCVEEGKMSLDDPLDRGSSSGNAAPPTLRQILSHTSMQGGELVFSYRPDRLDMLAAPLADCFDESFRKAMAAQLLDRTAMMNDSVPGPDAGTAAAADGIDSAAIDRYRRALDRLATGYVVNGTAATASSYSAQTLKPSSGLITSVADFAKFDLALKQGLLHRDSIAAAWTAPLGANGRRLPHGLGWFVQSYNGQTVVWQFGAGTASSSMVITVPGRGLTLVLLANSNGLARGFNLTAGDVSVSPFAKAFLNTFLR